MPLREIAYPSFKENKTIRQWFSVGRGAWVVILRSMGNIWPCLEKFLGVSTFWSGGSGWRPGVL